MNYKECYWTKNKRDTIDCQRYLINKGYAWCFYGKILNQNIMTKMELYML